MSKLPPLPFDIDENKIIKAIVPIPIHERVNILNDTGIAPTNAPAPQPKPVPAPVPAVPPKK